MVTEESLFLYKKIRGLEGRVVELERREVETVLKGIDGDMTIFGGIVCLVGSVLGRGFRVWYKKRTGRWYWGESVREMDYDTGVGVRGRDVSEAIRGLYMPRKEGV